MPRPGSEDAGTGGPVADGGEPALTDQPIEASAPEDFGLVQVWWGDGKGKTTAAMGMGLRAVGHGYRVHLLQFMKGGTQTVEDTRGEYNAIAALPGYSYENLGHYGWHRQGVGPDEDEHAAKAEAGVERARELLAASGEADLTAPLDPEGGPDDGVHMLILDEILYAANRGLIDPESVIDLVEAKPDDLELVLTGGHEAPAYLEGHVDLISHVSLEAHPFEDGTRGRKGTEY
ncbi:MAG: cob(I)yrinic acid a,c-diamide adenosyltransferase [Halodesulfurarchaeum sp.]